MEKNRKWALALGILLQCVLGVVSFAVPYHERKQELEKEVDKKILEIEYITQNGAFPRVEGHYAEEGYYVGYDAIDEPGMYIRLAAYNEWVSERGYEGRELTLADIEEYLSSEYNEDGSLRIRSGYEAIREYEDWYYEGGDGDIEEYWRELEEIVRIYSEENPGVLHSIAQRMTIPQLEELIQKKNDPSYEMNQEIMEGKEDGKE